MTGGSRPRGVLRVAATLPLAGPTLIIAGPTLPLAGPTLPLAGPTLILARLTLPLARLTLILAGLTLIPASCGGPGKGGPAPADGLIVYHEPQAQTGLLRRGGIQPMRWAFLAGDADIAQDVAMETQTGAIEGAGRTASSPDADSMRIARKILEESGKGSTMVLSRERFADLWSRLDAAGLFELTPYPGSEPPRTEPHFIVEAGSARRIFARPSVAAVREDDPGIAMVRRWQRSKIVFFDFLNER